MKKLTKSKSSKKSLPTPEYDSERETRVLLEEIDQNVKTVAEQHGSIIEKIDDLDIRVQSVETGVETVNIKVSALDTKVNRIERELETVKNEI